MTLIAVRPAAVLDICGTKTIQVTTVLSIVDVVFKEHLK